MKTPLYPKCRWCFTHGNPCYRDRPDQACRDYVLKKLKKRKCDNDLTGAKAPPQEDGARRYQPRLTDTRDVEYALKCRRCRRDQGRRYMPGNADKCRRCLKQRRQYIWDELPTRNEIPSQVHQRRSEAQKENATRRNQAVHGDRNPELTCISCHNKRLRCNRKRPYQAYLKLGKRYLSRRSDPRPPCKGCQRGGKSGKTKYCRQRPYSSYLRNKLLYIYVDQGGLVERTYAVPGAPARYALKPQDDDDPEYRNCETAGFAYNKQTPCHNYLIQTKVTKCVYHRREGVREVWPTVPYHRPKR
jgi:hypothetical protein